MWVTLAIVVGSVALTVCGFTWATRREEIAAVRRLEALTLLTLDDVAPNDLCAVRGSIVGPTTIPDPITDLPVVHYEARLLRRDRGAVLWKRSDGDALELDDGSTTRARVELLGAEIVIPYREAELTDGEPSARMAQLLSSIEHPVPEGEQGARYSIEHRALSIGDELTLVGTATRDGERLRFTAETPLHLTPETLAELQARQRADLRAMDRMLTIGALLGIVAIAIGVALLLLG